MSQSRKKARSGGIAAGAERSGHTASAGLEPVQQAASPEKFGGQNRQPGKNHEPAGAGSDQQNQANGEKCESEDSFDGSLNLSHSATPESGGFGWASVATPQF